MMKKAARVVRLRHREALEAAIAAYGGKLVQYLGDGSLSTFPSAVRAVSAAADIQRVLAKTCRFASVSTKARSLLMTKAYTEIA